MAEKEMIWDLSQMVDITDPEWMKEKLGSMVAEAENIRERYLGKIGGLDAVGLLELLELRDAHTLEFEGVSMYCRLLYAADSTKDVAKQLSNAYRKASVEAEQALAFVEIELGNLLADKPSLVEDTALAEYRHFLEKIERRVPHMLSETEERLVLAKDRNGINAWQLLQGDWLGTRSFEIEVEGEAKTLPYGEIIGFYQSPDRDLRRRANQVVYEDLGRDEILWASAIRAVCSDHLQMCELRKHPSPMTQSLIANDVDQETIDSLIRTMERNVGVYRRYLRVKARLMGLEKLANWDIVAPLPQAPSREYSWRDARALVVEAYSGFDEGFGEWVDEMFERRHIDGEVRRGKRSGAFCSSWLSGKSAYILQSYNKKLGNIYTMAHELGHAIHAYLGSRAQNPSNFSIGSCIAECGSVFGELLLTDKLLSKVESKEEKQAILAAMLDKFGMAAFQVSARVFFEQSMYDSIEQGRFLDGETVAKLWTAGRDKIYGDAVDWLPEMKWEWTMKVHYYMPNYRFYNYPYVFAQLFVYALYRLFKEQGKEFVPKLKRLLAARGSRSPAELAAELGFDIREEEFWERGMKQVEEFIDMLEETL
ncbi:MAG: M3 family oligoendopeptidase [Candidatus Bathyarchaeota archaeon]|nr:MAG: M3 family oligoendopeptidase [Candidatus Bathyarchaeota archaeon]